MTHAAEADLEEIGDFIAQDNSVRALSFVAELRTACAELDQFSEAHRFADGLAGEGVRRYTHGRYQIYYRADGNAVDVLRVLHQARDYLKAVSGR
ncbi:MAG: type II toxin-antitoxin system RelE/ParE family toxin [Bifidobacteriaceae bacterium]|nr:type II toxin-antitoxin system RelE/ParE family toxin [Bifidobacteriaceae bacterium]